MIATKSFWSAPINVRLMFRVVLPVLLKVTACTPLVVPRVWLLKIRLVAVRLTAGAAPVPVRITLCVLPGTLLLLSVMVKVAVREPGAVGLKVTLMVQLLFAATEAPQVEGGVSMKSLGLAPVKAGLPAMLRLTFPVLVRMMAWAVLGVPTF